MNNNLKNVLKWLLTATLLLLILAFLMPVHLVAAGKAWYFIGGGIVVIYCLYLSFMKADSATFLFNSEKRKAAGRLSNFKRFLLALTGILCVGTIGGVSSMRIDAALAAKGVIGKATTTGGEHVTRKSVKRGTQETYTLEFSFRTQAGEMVNGSESVSESEYDAVAVGSPFDIIYLPDHPQVFRVLIGEERRQQFMKTAAE